MKKKHFAGVLMLTAAVALGTVSPVALPNTAVVVQAAVTLTETSYAQVTATVKDGGVLEIANDKNGRNNLETIITDSNTHSYAFGKTKDEAIANAVKADAKVAEIKSGEHTFTTTVVPDDATYLVIVSRNALTDTTANGKAIELTREDDPTQGASGAYTYEAGVGKGQATVNAGKTLEYRLKNSEDKTWVKVTENAKFPSTPVGDGEKVIYEVRQAINVAGDKLPSKSVDVTIINRKQIGLEDLKSLTYRIENGELKIGNYKTNIKSVTTKSGIVAYAVVDTSGVATQPGSSTDLQDSNDETISGLADNKSVVVFVKDDYTKKLVLNIKKKATPILKASTSDYQLEADTGYTIEGKYTIQKGGAGNFTPAVLKEVGGKKVISVDGPGNSASVNYAVKAVGTEKSEIEFNGENKAEFTLESDATSAIAVNKINGKLDSASFGAIKYNVDTTEKKLTLNNVKKVLAGTNDKIRYGYEAATTELSANVDTVDIEVKDGKFVIEVADNPSLKRVITFKGVKGKDDNAFKQKYVTYSALKADMTNENDYHYKEAKATEAFKAIDDGIRKYTKSTEYLLCWAVTGSAINNIALNEDVTYKLSSPIKVLLQTEADAAKENSSSGGGAVIPSGGGSAGGSTDTKKDDAKKTDDKKNDTKKDGAMSDGNGAAVDKQSSVTVKKSGEVKFTAKALEKIVGDTAEAVKVTLKATSEMAKNVKGSKLVSKQVFTLNIKAGNMTVKESQLNGTKINVTLKVNLKKAPKIVWVMDLSTGKRVKATYKKGKLMFKTANLGKFVLVNKAK